MPADPLLLTLLRDVYDDETTLSTLAIGGQRFGFCCEDQDRGLNKEMPLAQIQQIKVRAETAIPAGVYQIATTWSPKYERPMPLLLNVPGYQGIRIHSGNDESQTAGCLLPGLGRSKSTMTVGQSRDACRDLYRMIAEAEKAGSEVWIAVVRDEVAWAEYRAGR